MQCPYFVEKTIIFLRSRCSHVIFFKFFMKKPLISCPYLVKKRKFRENCNILWAKKAIKTSFFLIFNEKINALMYIFCKNVHKNTLFSCPYLLSIFCQKKRPFSQKHCALMSYCSIFSWKTPCCHAHSKKRPFCQNNIYYGPKRSLGCPFFRFVITKSFLSCPYLVK